MSADAAAKLAECPEEGEMSEECMMARETAEKAKAAAEKAKAAGEEVIEQKTGGSG